MSSITGIQWVNVLTLIMTASSGACYTKIFQISPQIFQNHYNHIKTQELYSQKKLYMARQQCCRDMCKILWWFSTQLSLNTSKCLHKSVFTALSDTGPKSQLLIQIMDIIVLNWSIWSLPPWMTQLVAVTLTLYIGGKSFVDFGLCSGSFSVA